MSLAVRTKDFMNHYRVQTLGTEMFRVIDGIQRIDDKRKHLPAILGVALILMDELNLEPSDLIAKAVNAHNNLKLVDVETTRAMREYIRQELLND